jgi:hypothetical protein
MRGTPGLEGTRIGVCRKPGHGHDFRGELRPGGQGPAVAQQRILLLLAAAEAMRERIVGSRLQHIGVARGIGGKWRALVALGLLAGVLRAGLANGGAAPGLDAACNHHLGLTRLQQTHGHGHGIQARAALGIDGVRGAAIGQACGQCQHARRVAASAQGVADDDRVHGVGRQAALLQQ